MHGSVPASECDMGVLECRLGPAACQRPGPRETHAPSKTEAVGSNVVLVLTAAALVEVDACSAGHVACEAFLVTRHCSSLFVGVASLWAEWSLL